MLFNNHNNQLKRKRIFQKQKIFLPIYVCNADNLWINYKFVHCGQLKKTLFFAIHSCPNMF